MGGVEGESELLPPSGWGSEGEMRGVGEGGRREAMRL